MPTNKKQKKNVNRKICKDREYRRVYIKWLDSTAQKKIWWNFPDIIEEIKKSEAGDYFYSTGYLFEETKNHYYLANSIHFEDKKAIALGEIFSIPKGCVLQIKKA